MTIYIDDFIEASRFEAAKDQINEALNLKSTSKWIAFLEAHDIVIAPALQNVGKAIHEYKDVRVSTIPSDLRTYNDVPGTFFHKGLKLNGTTYPKHIVFLNVEATSKDYTTINFFAHELGHAIDYALGGDHYYSDEKAFSDLYTKYEDFFNATSLPKVLKDYLKLKNEYFAETFAFYRTKKKPLSACECGKVYFDATFDKTITSKTPSNYLKDECPDLYQHFNELPKKPS